MKPIDAILESKNDLAFIFDRCLAVTGRILKVDYERSQDNDDITLIRQRLNDAAYACQLALSLIGVATNVTMASQAVARHKGGARNEG